MISIMMIGTYMKIGMEVDIDSICLKTNCEGNMLLIEILKHVDLINISLRIV